MATKAKNQKTIQGLRVLLADNFVLYVKTQNFHWHLEGLDFVPMHEFLGTLYKDLFEAVDEIGERLRQLGVAAPASLKEFLQLSSLKEAKGQTKSKDILKTLLADHLSLIETNRKVMLASESEDDMVTNDFVIERMAYHEKIVWMLKATLESKA